MKRFLHIQLITSSLHRRYSSSYNFENISKLIDIHPTVKYAIDNKKPIVALESTIITHGMPFPYNLRTARDVEDIIRTDSSTPATIAIIDGRIKVGLTDDEFQRLSNPTGIKPIKCSCRDLSFVVGRKLCGGTTVAGTLIVADMLGIKVFATGGIGGVHRSFSETLDISADLVELGKHPVAVICSGVKSILDIPKTLEYLETQGVCVASYQSELKNFPGFYTSSSGFKVPYNFDTPQEVAAVFNAGLQLGLKSSLVIGVPIPIKYGIDEDLINVAIEKAINTALEQGIKGKNVTPFILDAVSKITKGKSLECNIALIKNNAKIASKIAKALSQCNQRSDNYIASDRNPRNIEDTNSNFENKEMDKKIPVIIGACIFDIYVKATESDLELDGATYNVKSQPYCGGVGRNIAEGLAKLYGEVNLISVVGDDENGHTLKTSLPPSCAKNVFMDKNNLTSNSIVVLDKFGECKLVLADMKIHKAITPNMVLDEIKALAAAPLIVIDANIPINTMSKVLDIAHKYNRPVFFEPTDMRIANKPFQLDRQLTQQIKFISPNIYELNLISKSLTNFGIENISEEIVSDKTMILKITTELIRGVIEYVDCIIVTLGKNGVVIASKSSQNNYFDENFNYILPKVSNKYECRYYPVIPTKKLVNVSGAGDSFASGFISAMLQGYKESSCVFVGLQAANQALQSEGAVPEKYFDNISVMNEWCMSSCKFENLSF